MTAERLKSLSGTSYVTIVYVTNFAKADITSASRYDFERDFECS